jgi:hypothetical protein
MSQLQVTGEAKIRDIQGPVIANSGVITALDGAASQYVRGDGTLADFPTSSGGGSSVSYYLNSSVSQGTIGGVAYRELSKEPIIGAGTDIAISANGYIASYITDANDPDVVIVPGGNFNCEFYFSVNNETGNPTTYAELYKYDGTTFTLLGSSVGVPESINQGTVINPYYFAIPVATATLALTDRLAIRIYVNVDGRTVTLHTENGHLCQVVTTLSKGMVSLNNLTDQSQFITTGTSGTNFNIVSSGDTHTFNLPVASATNTGKLSNTDWSTFNAKQPAGNYVTLDTTQTITAAKTFTENPIINGTGTNSAYTILQSAGTNKWRIGNNYAAGVNTFDIFAYDNTTTPLSINSNGAMTLSANVTTTGAQFVQNGFYLTNANGGYLAGYTLMYGKDDGINFALRNGTGGASFIFPSANSYAYTFPAATGTLALTSNLSSYLPLTGGTLTGALNGTSATFTNTSTFRATGNAYTNGSIILQSSSGATSTYLTNSGGIFYLSNNGSTDHLQIASTGAATFSSSVTATSLTLSSASTPLLQIIDTTNSKSLLFGADDNNTFIRSSSSTPIFLQVNGGDTALTLASNQAATFSSSVGVGGAPSGTYGTLSVFGGISTKDDNNGKLEIGRYSSGAPNSYIKIGTNSGSLRITNAADSADLVTFTNGGNVGIGTSSPDYPLVVQANSGGAQAVKLLGRSSDNISILSFHNNANSTQYGYIAGIPTEFRINSGSSIPITFTNADTERMRITSGGNVLIGTGIVGAAGGALFQLAQSNNNWIHYIGNTASSGGIFGTYINFVNQAPNNTGSYFLFCGDNSTSRMFIYGNGGIANYQANDVNLSDERTKKDIIPLESYWDKFKAIEIVKFKYKDQTHDDFNIGVIAQQVEAVAPEFIDVDGWGETPEDGEPLKSVYTADLHHATIKVLQECMAKIEEQQAQIEELKQLILNK